MAEVEDHGKPLRFLVAGAGAVGSAFGGMLRLAGHDVALLGRNRDHMRAISERGLRVTGLWGERTTEGFDVLSGADEVADADYVLVTTKSFDTAAIMDEVAPRARAAQFVTLQNGLGNVEAVSERVGPERTIGGMVIIGFEITSPGIVAVTVFGGDVLVGRPCTPAGCEPDEIVARLASAFARAGIPARPTGNIEGAVWGKVLYNCALNALGSVLRVPYGELAAPPAWAVIEDIVREAFAVARAEGVRLAWATPEEYLEVLASRQLPDTAAHRSSMLQDLERGRRTEIDHLNGAVARLGAEKGVPTPVNAALAALVRFGEARAGRTLRRPAAGRRETPGE
ncbi:MAG: ketopantoate reductase family protein [Planctomycetota bacterium]